jgi:uncharacterized protein
MKFIVDQTLGGLAKWLRLCGYDTAQLKLAGQDWQSWPTPAEGTVILTRQAAALDRTDRGDLMLVKTNTPEAQLLEVFGRLKLSSRELQPLNRCSRCNQVLSPIAKELAWGRVPEYILHKNTQFYECPSCQQLFWAGSHHEKILGKIKKIGAQAGG